MFRKEVEYICMVFHLCFTVIIAPFFGTPTLLYFLYHGFICRYLAILYIVFTLLTWHKKDKGGWPCLWFKSSTYVGLGTTYFPVKLHKPKVPFEDQKYIIGMHPHGFFSFPLFAYMNNTTEQYKDMFGADIVYTVVASHMFKIPFFRDYILALGGIGGSEESILNALNRPGRSFVTIVVGGPKETFNSNEHVLLLKNRKGFCRVALKAGASIIPTYAFGANDTFEFVNLPEKHCFRRIQTYFCNKLHIPTVVTKGSWPFQYFFVMPKRMPINVVHGTPIKVERVESPTEEAIDALCDRYIQELTRLFDENKARFCVNPSVELIIR